MLIPVILSGGAGTRLWPASRDSHPKPFMTLPDGSTLIQKTLARVCSLPNITKTLTLTNEQYYFHSRDLYNEVSTDDKIFEHDYLLEPISRNTASAIALAAHWALTHDPDAVLLVLPADHLIIDIDAFVKNVRQAVLLAEQCILVTFGISPTRPETGFGYIEASTPMEGAFKCSRFIEKPDLKTAEHYLQQENFFWNSGMFCFKASVLLDELIIHAPNLSKQAFQVWESRVLTDRPVRFNLELFKNLDDISIDYALMEKTDNVVVIPANFDWNDIGTWDTMSKLCNVIDSQGNSFDNCETLFIDSSDCYIKGENRFVAAVGLDNILIIDTADALLILNRSKVQQVKQVVDYLKIRKHSAFHSHKKVHRPWGTYTILETSPRFKIKQIVVKPGAKLSLQIHHHRSEHWVVVSGAAKVTKGDQEIFIRTNQSTYIAAGVAHRLENMGVIECVMIEVQVGDYVGEDDIVRLSDSYGRVDL